MRTFAIAIALLLEQTRARVLQQNAPVNADSHHRCAESSTVPVACPILSSMRPTRTLKTATATAPSPWIANVKPFTPQEATTVTG